MRRLCVCVKEDTQQDWSRQFIPSFQAKCMRLCLRGLLETEAMGKWNPLSLARVLKFPEYMFCMC